MRWTFRIVFALFLALFAAGLFSLTRLAKKPETLYAPAVTEIEERWGVHLSFQEANFSFLPFPVLRMNGLRLEPVTDRWEPFSADEMRLSFDFLSLLFGKARISGVRVANAKGTFWGFPLEEVDFKVRGLGSRGFSPFEWKARERGGREVLRGKGGVSLENWEGEIWTNLGLKGEMVMKDLALKEWATGAFESFPKAAFSGELNGKLQFDKVRGKNELTARTQFEIQNFKPESAESFPLKGGAQILRRLEEPALELQSFTLEAPFARLDGKGLINIETGEITEVRISGRNVVLEETVRYFPALESVLPSGVGFSGASEFDVTLQGTWDYLSLHANWNLTQAVLTHGTALSKPKDFPMGITCDFILKSGSFLSGDFSLRLHRLTAKGSFTELDLKTGVGELTLITNKFDLAGWEPLLPFLQSYKVSGFAKVLTHGKGNWTRPAEVKRTLNLTLENASFLSSEGKGVQEANVLMDASGLSLRIKEGRFKIGESPVFVQTEIYNLRENPKGDVTIISPHLDLPAAVEHLKAVKPFLAWVRPEGVLETVEKKVRPYFPKSTPLEELTLDLKVEEGKWTLENLVFHSLGGAFQISGAWEGGHAGSSFWMDAEVDRANLTRYFEGTRPGKKVLDGNIFFKGRFQGSGTKPGEISQSLSGQGTLAVTNGEWHGLDLMTPLKALGPFERLESQRSGSTPLNDLKADWNYRERKFETKNFLLLSDEWWLEGEGNLSAGGTFNSRFDAYLSKPLTEKVLASWGVPGKEGGKLLGPIPFLLLGSFSQPVAKPDERRLPSFLEDVRARRYRRILKDPFKD